MANLEEALEACRELQVFAKAHRSTQPPKHDAGLIVLWTVARSDKTFQAILHLCDPDTGGGYGEQAGMLNRSLFEDMVTAHWATRFPARAVRQIAEQDRYVGLEGGRALKRHKMLRPGATLPKMTEAEEARLKKHYSRGGWTQKSVPEMVKAITPMWVDKNEKRLLMQMHDLTHRVNNTLMHHSARSLSRNVTETAQGYAFNAGRSESFLPAALGMAFWTYVQTLTLVASKKIEKDLLKLYIKHRDVYSKVGPPLESASTDEAKTA